MSRYIKPLKEKILTNTESYFCSDCPIAPHCYCCQVQQDRQAEFWKDLHEKETSERKPFSDHFSRHQSDFTSNYRNSTQPSKASKLNSLVIRAEERQARASGRVTVHPKPKSPVRIQIQKKLKSPPASSKKSRAPPPPSRSSSPNREFIPLPPKISFTHQGLDKFEDDERLLSEDTKPKTLKDFEHKQF